MFKTPRLRALSRGCAVLALAAGFYIGLTAENDGEAPASGLRGIDLIPTPEPLPDGAQRIEPPQPVSAEVVGEAVEEVTEAFNRLDLSGVLSEDFSEGAQLKDSLNFDVPKDTRMRVNSVRSTTVLQQFVMTGEGGTQQRVSRVSAILETQLNVNDPALGYMTVPGQNEVIFDIVEEVAQ